ncbi:MAG TPA: hypothetical protein VGS79_06935 [Puia sp.]|nr:hypothetical protein [Puia sp.]
MRSFLVILCVLLGLGYEVKGQDLTGQWTGAAMAEGQNHKLVLSITETDSSIAGVLHWYTPSTRTIRHIIIRGRFFGHDSTLTIRWDSGVTTNGVALGGPPGGFYTLTYYRTPGRRDRLEGEWHMGDEFTGHFDLTIRLEKKAPPFIPLPVIKPPVHKSDTPDVKRYPILQGRESPVVARIPVTGTDTARIELYDNGEIDGDSVSLFVNNALLVQHVLLDVQPKVILVPIDKSRPVNTLLLVAENLGRLPPNTALMVVTVHGKTYNLFLSTDYKTNASIQFNLQE